MRHALIPQDRIDRLAQIIARARSTGNAEALSRAIDLLGQVLEQNASEADVSQNQPDPITRAHARARGDGDGLHKLRKGRDRCGATRRDGEPCQAPAIEGGLVCRRHGGGAPQVKIAAEHFRNKLAAYSAGRDFEEARGTPGEFDVLCKALRAQRDLDAYEVKLGLLAELRAEVRQKRAARARDPGTP